ncbi:MAG: nuclear transport factor 2 family protein [Acidimicrobiia bacterium]
MDERELLQRLLDIEDIKRLKARYFRALDHQDWGEFANVFALDAHLEVPEGNMSEHGRDAVVASVSGVLEGARTVHHGHMPEIELTGTDTARGVWAVSDYVEFPVAEGRDRVGLQGYGYYTEEYVREDGEWRIKRLHLSRLRVDPLAGKAAPLDAPSSSSSS